MVSGRLSDPQLLVFSGHLQGEITSGFSSAAANTNFGELRPLQKGKWQSVLEDIRKVSSI